VVTAAGEVLRRVIVAGVLAITIGNLTLVRPAHAQPAPAPPVLVAPKLIGDAAAPYPDGAEGDANVVVKLTIGKDGRVSAAEATGAAPRFLSAAENAARSYKFEPATRNGTPVAAVVRVLVHFTRIVVETPPVAAEPEVAPPAVSQVPVALAGRPKPKSPISSAPENVTIQGKQLPAPTVQTVARAEVRLLPGAFGDPFRAIDALPGVTPTISGLPFYYVRGAPPGNVGYYLDGIRMPYLFHFGLGPSVVNAAIVDRVDLYKSAFPAEFGRYAGAIVSATLTEPKGALRAEGNLRLFDVGGAIEVPFADGRGSLMAGGRFSYAAALLSLLAPNVELNYSDYQARATYRVTDHDEIRLYAMGAYDLVASTLAGERRVIFASEFHRQDLRYRHRVGRRGLLESAVTVGIDRTRIDGARFARDYLVALRAKYETPLTDTLQLRVGADSVTDIYRSDLPNPYAVSDLEFFAAQSLYRKRIDHVFGLRSEVVWTPVPRFMLTAGVRGDAYDSYGASDVTLDIRLSGKLRCTRDMTFSFAAGTAHQPMTFPVPIPAVQPAGLQGGLQRVGQSSLQVDYALPLSMSAQAAVFLNSFRQVSDVALSTSKSPFETDPAQRRLGGYAYGLELTLRRRMTRDLGFVASYTLSRNLRAQRDGAAAPSLFDRTHVLSIAATYALGRGFRVGGRVIAYSGWPTLDADAKPARLPLFSRLDVRAEKRWSFAAGRWLAVVLEGVNVTLAEEVLSQKCVAGQCTPQNFGPISVPSLGLEGGL
jgi:hypothetical protein